MRMLAGLSRPTHRGRASPAVSRPTTASSSRDRLPGAGSAALSPVERGGSPGARLAHEPGVGRARSRATDCAACASRSTGRWSSSRAGCGPRSRWPSRSASARGVAARRAGRRARPAGSTRVPGVARRGRVADGDVTVLLSSHLLPDLERVCDHLILLADAAAGDLRRDRRSARVAQAAERATRDTATIEREHHIAHPHHAPPAKSASWSSCNGPSSTRHGASTTSASRRSCSRTSVSTPAPDLLEEVR